MSDLVYTCSCCGFSLPMLDNEFPLHCICGVRINSRIDKVKCTESFGSKPTITTSVKCIYQGDKIGKVTCLPCGGTVSNRFACSKFGECTLVKQIDGVKCCAMCEDRIIPSMLSAVGVTTAPRQEPTLHRTLKSLADSGWDSFTVFDDSGLTGAWDTWRLSLQELMSKEPAADYYLVVQDDCEIAVGARQYIESLPQIKEESILSLYCSGRYSYTTQTRLPKDKRFIGAVAVAIPRITASRMLTGGCLNSSSRQGIDITLGKWCHANNIPIYIHAPSLVQHIGNTSTLGHHEPPARDVIADCKELVK